MKKRIFNIITLAISLIALAFSFIRITPFSFSSDTYIGVIATFIGVSVTLLIGFQIYNYLELKKEIDKLKLLKKGVSKTKKNISILDHEVQESLDQITAKLLSLEQNNTTAFLAQQKALISSLKANRKDFQIIFSGLKNYITGINLNNFNAKSSKEKEKQISDYIQKSDIIDSRIKELENYYCIKYEYEHIMKCFKLRVNNTKKNILISEEERQEILR